jgi:hypothetical protein
MNHWKFPFGLLLLLHILNIAQKLFDWVMDLDKVVELVERVFVE